MLFEDFGTKLEEYLRQAQDAHRRGRPHERLRVLLLRFLEANFHVDIEEVEIEKDVRAGKVRGAIDLLYRNIIFDVKSNLSEERATGQSQLLKYLQATAHGEQHFGVLTDGLSFEVYALRDGALKPVQPATHLLRLAQEKRHDEALLWLDSLLFFSKNVKPTSHRILRCFGAQSFIFHAASQQLNRLYKRVSADGSVRVKFDEWNRLLAKVYGTEVGTEDLFIRHTYLSLFAKLLAYATISHQPPSSDELEGIVDGERFRARGFPDLCEADFFAWVLQHEIRAEAIVLLRGLCQPLGVYDLSTLSEDLLKELYQGLVDPETRRDLGEFYTPDWLAELTLREAGFRAKRSLLDPACGSGTFLFTALRLLREKGMTGTRLIRFAQDNIMGVDVHPLAVTISKVNYLLALAPDLGAYTGEGGIALPVYMADALLKEEERKNENLIAVPVAAKPGARALFFHIPADMALDAGGLNRAVQLMCDYAQQEEEPQRLVEGLANALKQAEVRPEWLPFWRQNLRLMIKLVRDKRDTIYGFILRNAYRPTLLAQRRFDFVVGNPPWLAYRYVRNPEYQRQVKAMVLAYGLISSKEVSLFTHMDTSTLFFEHCFARYLKPEGTIAFVMPRSVLTGAKQHAAFQAKGFSKLIDLEDVSPLFNVPACVVFRETQSSRTADIPMKRASKRASRNLPAKNMPWCDARHYLRLRPATYSPPSLPTGTSPYYDEVVQGASLVPYTLWYVTPSPQPGMRAIDRNKPYLETDASAQQNAKKPWNEVIMSGEVEARFLYATLLSRNLLPFGYTSLSMVVVPILQGEADKPLEILTATVASSKGFPELSDWLREAEQQWDKKRKSIQLDIYRRLDYQRLLTSQKPSGVYKVLYNTSGTHIAACVIDTVAQPAPEVNGLPTNGFVAMTKTYWYEASDQSEAHYVAAFLNSPLVNQAIKPYQSRGLWGERDIHRRPFEILPIPHFDASEKTHIALADISLECHAKVAEIAQELRGSIGIKRAEVRRILKPELARIDTLAKEILGNALGQAAASTASAHPGLDFSADE